MRESIGTAANRPSPITCPVHPDEVVEVQSEPGYRLRVRFADGLSGFADLKTLIHSRHAGVFAQLADLVLFSAVYVEAGAVAWPCGVDLAPDTMYEAIRASGSWILT